MQTTVKFESLLQAGAHFGFSKSRRHPSAKPFIFGIKNRVEIFDLEKTADCLSKAEDFLKKIAENKGVILFVGSKNEASKIIKEMAERVNMPYVNGRWIGGTLTNFSEIKKRIERMENLISQKEKGELTKYTKKERLLIDREIENLQQMFGGLRSLTGLPKALFIVDPKKEAIAVAEAIKKSVPVVALAGSDCDLNLLNRPIPANDSSVSSIHFFVEQIAKAIGEGQKQHDANTRINSANDTNKIQVAKL
jgi:small subunit ribosomal protein S2